MTIQKITKQHAEQVMKSAKKIASIKEYSKKDDCEIKASYFQSENSFLEIVTRNYNSLRKDSVSGYFLYESPYPVIFALMHSCDHKFHQQAEALYRKYIEPKKTVSIHLPSEIMQRIEMLADERNCSIELMLFNLIDQGLASEHEINDFYESYEMRTQQLDRNNLDELFVNSIIVNNKEVL